MAEYPGLMPFGLKRDERERLGLSSPCPKCDGLGVDVQYCLKHHAGQAAYETWVGDHEHLDLTCSWCGYIRFMATADEP